MNILYLIILHIGSKTTKYLYSLFLQIIKAFPHNVKYENTSSISFYNMLIIHYILNPHSIL